uniref:Actin-related protein 3 n=1 Tax=Auxenochlorella protothecoides TaxID=3075 RepID=A0A1D1ZN60_AUXPR
MDDFARPALVIDCGSAFIKAGFAGEVSPAVRDPSTVPRAAGLEPGPPLVPVKHGIVQDWDAMEQLWLDVTYRRLHVYTSDQPVILTEPPQNSPESREQAAEVMFESLDVPALHIGVQAQLALYADYAARQAMGSQTSSASLTGLVVESGEGCTHVIPLVDGFLLASGTRSMPLGGAQLTRHIQALMRKGAAPPPPDQSLEIAVAVKERHCFVTASGVGPGAAPAATRSPAAYQTVHSRTGQPLRIQLGEERWRGPELFFDPGAFTKDAMPSLPDLIDDAIQACPIDTRRALYGNIVLSGGSTLFKGLARRLETEVQARVAARVQGRAPASHAAATGVEVHVVTHPMQHFGAWFGGSVLGASEAFREVAITRAAYMETGPTIVRNNVVHSDW